MGHLRQGVLTGESRSGGVRRRRRRVHDRPILNLSSVGLPTVPDRHGWADIDLDPVTNAFAAAGVRIWGVSATVNLIHPDLQRRVRERRDVLALLGQVGAATLWGSAGDFTLCTGTRDRDNQWRRHPANDEPDAWRDLIDALAELLPHAEHAGVALGVEPEPGNVVADATRAAQLLDEMQAARGTLGIVLDPANPVQDHPVDQAERIIGQAVELLGDDGDLACTPRTSMAGRRPRGRVCWTTR